MLVSFSLLTKNINAGLFLNHEKTKDNMFDSRKVCTKKANHMFFFYVVNFQLTIFSMSTLKIKTVFNVDFQADDASQSLSTHLKIPIILLYAVFLLKCTLVGFFFKL